MNKIKVYISHSIRGQKGKDATHDDMVQNNQRAITFGIILSCSKFPQVDFYIPGEHDRFVLIAYESGMLTEKQILEVDCQILKDHHILLNYIPDQYISGGMLTENMYAQMNGIPILMAQNIEAAEKVLNRFLENLTRNGK